MARGFRKCGYWFFGIRGLCLHCRAAVGIKSNDQVTQIMSGWNFLHARWQVKWQAFIYDTTVFALSICPSCCLMTFFRMIFLCNVGQHFIYPPPPRVLINLVLYFLCVAFPVFFYYLFLLNFHTALKCLIMFMQSFPVSAFIVSITCSILNRPLLLCFI